MQLYCVLKWFQMEDEVCYRTKRQYKALQQPKAAAVGCYQLQYLSYTAILTFSIVPIHRIKALEQLGHIQIKSSLSLSYS